MPKVCADLVAIDGEVDRKFKKKDKNCLISSGFIRFDIFDNFSHHMNLMSQQMIQQGNLAKEKAATSLMYFIISYYFLFVHE